MIEQSISNHTLLETLVRNTPCDERTKNKFLERLVEGFITRNENEKSHLCAFFLLFDNKSGKLFIGNHKKSGLWLFPGGHLDPGEIPTECVKREAKEETDIVLTDRQIGEPSLLTKIEIENPERQKCRVHFDIWFFIAVDQKIQMSEEKLSKEYSDWGWLTPEEIRQLPNLPNYIETVLQAIETNMS